jgi:hypothetical protein
MGDSILDGGVYSPGIVRVGSAGLAIAQTLTLAVKKKRNCFPEPAVSLGGGMDAAFKCSFLVPQLDAKAVQM